MQVRTRILNTTLGVTAALALVASQSTGTALSAQATLDDVTATPAAQLAARSAAGPTATISGSAAVGKKLTAKTGSWPKGTKLSYRWYANGSLIKGITTSSYKISSVRATKRITVTVTGKRSGHATVTVTSKPTAKVQLIGKPKLSGSAVATRKVTAKVGTWTSGTTFRYVWFLSGKQISGATSKSITLKTSWKGKKLKKAKVTGRKSGYTTLSAKTAYSSAIKMPSSYDPGDSWDCPSWAPIKGNESSMIYHLPGQRYYEVTNPEMCFATQSAAKNAGYRKAKV